MKQNKLLRTLCAHMAVVFCLSLAACSQIPSGSEPTMDPVLTQRRDAAEAFMRRMGNVRWRVTEDILYTIASDKLPEDDIGNATCLELKAGRTYQGLPYSYAGSTDTTFLEYACEPENGVYTITGITWESLSGGGSVARLGNDCSSAVAQAWAHIGADIAMTSTKNMALKKGYLPVGQYVSHESDNTNSAIICAANGEQTMYAAYAQLQKADGLVYRTSSSGHAMMVVTNTPVYNKDGSIDGEASKVTILDQTRTHFRAEECFYDENLKENVYPFYGIDTEFTYQYLMKKGCFPITCKALIDPAPIAEPVVTDSQTEFNKDTLLSGTITCEWMIDTLTMTITDPDGNVVQEGAIRGVRGKNRTVELERFLTDNPAGVRGYIKPEALTAGSYHCKLICRLSSGEELTVRNFDFTV